MQSKSLDIEERIKALDKSIELCKQLLIIQDFVFDGQIQTQYRKQINDLIKSWEGRKKDLQKLSKEISSKKEKANKLLNK
jgi:hypothetical protein